MTLADETVSRRSEEVLAIRLANQESEHLRSGRERLNHDIFHGVPKTVAFLYHDSFLAFVNIIGYASLDPVSLIRLRSYRVSRFNKLSKEIGGVQDTLGYTSSEQTAHLSG